MSEEQMEDGGGGGRAGWDAGRVRRLRGHLGETQAAFAARLGARQQTVSEWETGSSRPRGISGRLLQMIAEQHGFYSAEAGEGESHEGDGERDRGARDEG